MKEILSKMYGIIHERAIQKGMKTESHPYEFGTYEVKCIVEITEEKTITLFAVLKNGFQSWEDAIYTTNSFKELRQWLQENIEKIS